MPPSYDLGSILTKLEAHHQRATYGAVARLLGVLPRGVMQGKPKTPHHSWIVSAETGMPTGYGPGQHHVDLLEQSWVIDTPEMLAEWLQSIE